MEQYQDAIFPCGLYVLQAMEHVSEGGDPKALPHVDPWHAREDVLHLILQEPHLPS